MIETESAGGVVLKGNMVLVVSQHGTSWSLPKGHAEKGEDRIQAAKREIYEETGITDLQLVKGLGTYQRHKIDKAGKEDKGEFKTIYMFQFKTDQEILKPVDVENPEAKWIPKEKVADVLTHPKDKEFYCSVKNKI